MDKLVERARAMREEAHAPYSQFRVGAVLKTSDGKIFTGCNIENRNYTNSMHAEQVAFAEAVKNGHDSFEAIAISTTKNSGSAPCGFCRQTMAEFCDDSFTILVDEEGEVAEYTLGELLPHGMTREEVRK
jgi:cytidine deaminase